jgi:hypothetical protein
MATIATVKRWSLTPARSVRVAAPGHVAVGRGV